jgi:hypothetical protein
MAASRKGTHILGWMILGLIFAAQMWQYSHYQPRIAAGNGRGDDGVYYGVMAEQIYRDQTISTVTPFVYRVGAPWLAAQYAHISGVSIDDAFQHISLALTFTSLTLMYGLGLLLTSPPFALLATTLFALPWWGYPRNVWFYPLLSDLPWLVLILLALILLVSWPSQSNSAYRIISYAIICLLAPLTRETGVIAPALFIFSRPWLYQFYSFEFFLGDNAPEQKKRIRTSLRDVQLGIFFAGVSALSALYVRSVVVPSGAVQLSPGTPYTILTALLESVKHNTLWHFVNCFFLAYGGPLLAIFVILHRSWRVELQRYPALAVYWFLVTCLAFIGGVNTLRFLSWASPVALIWIAVLAKQFCRAPRPLRKKVIATALVVANVLFYLKIIHPLEGYYSDYTAWMKWGGLQLSPFESSYQLLPCLALFLTNIFIGRYIAPDGR